MSQTKGPIKWRHCSGCGDDFPCFAVKPLYLPKWVGNIEFGNHYFCLACRPAVLEKVREMIAVESEIVFSVK